MAEIAHFLKENDLSVDTTVEVFITVSRDDRLIACGGIAGNIIKCVAISESVRGEGLALTLATELINLASGAALHPSFYLYQNGIRSAV